MEIIETYAIQHPTDAARDVGILRIMTAADGGPHLATRVEVLAFDQGGLEQGAHRLTYIKTEIADPTEPRRFRHLRLVNDNGAQA